jgi:hypothetical protein
MSDKIGTRWLIDWLEVRHSNYGRGGGVGRGRGVKRGLGVGEHLSVHGVGVGVGVGVATGVYSSALATGKTASGAPSDEEGALSGSTRKEAFELLLSPAATRTMPSDSNIAV